jgi:tRNA dimethylallyltransferase
VSEALVAICGPTGVGKTEIAIEIAALLRERGELPVAVSADAFQLYEGLDVLLAKPSDEQLARLEHRLLSFVPIDQAFSVAQFAERAHGEIDSLLGEGRTAIVVGGTGLYLRAALTDLDLKPPPDRGLREELERELAELGLKALHAQLPAEVADAVHPHDRRRIVRALELERMGERRYESSDQLWSDELRRQTALFGIVMDRDKLGERLADRVDHMLAAAVVEEVELALEKGASKTARKAIGFKEIEGYIEGAIGLDEAATRIKRRHGHYVKRQLTWMRKLAAVALIDRTGLNERDAAAAILARLTDKVAPGGGFADQVVN